MRAKLFIHLNADTDDAVSWVRIGTEESVRQHHNVNHGTLHDLATISAGCRIIVLAPGADVLLTTASIPSGNRQRIMNALPYALEDQLATDVDGLHFAIGERIDSTCIHAAVIDRARMDRWLERLRQVRIEPDVITSETLALPWLESDITWIILISENQALVRTGQQSGWVADIDNLDALLRIALHEAGNARPDQVRVIACTHPMPLPDLLADTDIVVNIEQSNESVLAILGRGYNEKNIINFLQGAYNRREQLGKLWKPWRPAAAMLAILLFIQVGIKITDYVHLKTESDELTQQIAQTYLRTFPDARKVVNPRAQMEQRLKELRGGDTESSGFLPLLAIIGQTLKETPGLEIQRINYNEGKIDLALIIGDLQSLDQLKQRLATQTGLTANIESAASRDNKVEARLQISGQTRDKTS